MKTPIDYAHIPTRHEQINLRLEAWARWVRVAPKPWGTQPMWRNAKTPRQWDITPHVHQTLNTLEASETERAVSFLPEKHRTAIRWAYVFPWVPDNVIRRDLGATRDALSKLLDDARDLLCNRLREKIVDTA